MPPVHFQAPSRSNMKKGREIDRMQFFLKKFTFFSSLYRNSRNHGNGIVNITEIHSVIVRSLRTSGRPKGKSRLNGAYRLRLMKSIQTGRHLFSSFPEFCGSLALKHSLIKSGFPYTTPSEIQIFFSAPSHVFYYLSSVLQSTIVNIQFH